MQLSIGSNKCSVTLLMRYSVEVVLHDVFAAILAAPDGDKDDRERSSRVPSKPVRDKVRHMVHRG